MYPVLFLGHDMFSQSVKSTSVILSEITWTVTDLEVLRELLLS